MALLAALLGVAVLGHPPTADTSGCCHLMRDASLRLEDASRHETATL